MKVAMTNGGGYILVGWFLRDMRVCLLEIGVEMEMQLGL